MNTATAEHGAFHSSKVIPGRNVTIFDPHAPKSVPAHVPEIDTQIAKSAARVQLIKTGEVVTAIEIHCTCGEVIRLDCEY